MTFSSAFYDRYACWMAEPLSDSILRRIRVRHGTKLRRRRVHTHVAVRRLWLLSLLVVAACGLISRPANITYAKLFEDGVTLQLNVVVCAETASGSFEEREDSVVVGVRVRPQGGDCGLGVTLVLDNPLGDRQLIDEFDDQAIPVEIKG